MNVIVFASRKGGSGKSTLAAHLAAHVHKSTRPCLLVDGDPQGSLTLWHSQRGNRGPALATAARGIERERGTDNGEIGGIINRAACSRGSASAVAARAFLRASSTRTTRTAVAARSGVAGKGAVRERKSS